MKSVYIFVSLLLIFTAIESNSKGFVNPNDRFSLLNPQLRQIFQSDRLEKVSSQYRPERILPISQHKEGDYTFSKNIRVNDDSAGTADHWTKWGGANVIVARSDTLYVVWSDARECSNGSQIYFAKSINGGESFLPNVKVDDMSPGTSDKFFPSIAVDAIGKIYVAWVDFRNSSGDVYFAKSEDGGLTFSKNICVADTSIREIQYGVSIGVAGDNVYIIWGDTRHECRIYFDRSGDGGLTFGKDIKVDDFPVDDSSYVELLPCIDVLGDTVYTVWYHVNMSTYEVDIRFDKSIDGGVTFGTDIKVEASGIGQYNPALTVDRNGTIHIVFNNMDSTASFQVLYAKSTDGGVSFGQITEVTDTTISVTNMAGGSGINIATDCCGNPYCIWDDLRDSPEQYIYHPYFSYSNDGGNSFSKNVRVVDKPGAVGNIYQWGVGLTVDANKNVYAVWSDIRNDPQSNLFDDIYFAKGTLAGIEESKAESSDRSGKAEILEVYPNPFSGKTVIRYLTPEARSTKQETRLTIYDLTGRLVKSFPLITNHLSLSTVVYWDGSDDSGKLLSGGIYFCKLQVGDGSVTKKMLLLR